MGPAFQPVLTCDEARRFEAAWFGGDERREWAAMSAAGEGVAAGLLKDFDEIGGWVDGDDLLVLVGKGHNGGDALIAAHVILGRFPRSRAIVWLAQGERNLRPLTQAALRDLVQGSPGRVEISDRVPLSVGVIVDGIYGYSFRPPLDQAAAALIAKAAAVPARLRVAVDLPSGLDDPRAFAADFTYATGLLKAPLLRLGNAGRIRLVDIEFDAAASFSDGADWVVSAAALQPLRGLRPSRVDKRSYGHLLVIGGSRDYPGAVMMAVMAALQSGVGLVTAFVPESLAPAFAAARPEAMWVGWPETPSGGLAMEGLHLLRARLDRGSALLIGPGLGRERETLAMAAEAVRLAGCPVLLDADAIETEVIAAARRPCVITPHAGEFVRIGGREDEVAGYARDRQVVLVLKGPVTRISDGARVLHSLFGGPVLARGGSGDLLAGMIGSRLAQPGAVAIEAAIQGVVWHGRAADALSRARGSLSVRATELLDYLGPAIKD